MKISLVLVAVSSAAANIIHQPESLPVDLGNMSNESLDLR